MISDVIEPVALRRNVAYGEFLDSIKNFAKNKLPHNYVYKPEEYNCQMKEMVSSRCKRNE